LWGEREISSDQIGAWVMTALSGLDQVAYVRFASVYHSFEDVEAFRRQIEQLEHERLKAGDHQLPLIKETRRRKKK
jgi:transcriptional repressor NrdR